MREKKQQAGTLQEEIARQGKYWKKNQIWTLALAAVVLVILLFRSGFSVAPGPTELMLTMHDGQERTVPYSAVTQVRLLEDPQYGTMIEGRQTRQGNSGTWDHPDWGEYTLCVYASSSSAVWLQADGQCYVVSLSSAEETRQLYQTILEKSAVSR